MVVTGMREAMESVGERIAESAAHLDAAMHRLLVDVRCFDDGGGWHAQGAQSCAHWLSWRVGWDLGTARERVRVAHRLAESPLLDDALRRGAVSYSKVRAITRVATAQNVELLLQCALHATAAQLERICRQYRAVQRQAEVGPEDERTRRVVTRRALDDGMVRIEAVLRPEEAALVWATIEQAAKDTTSDRFDRADGLCAVAQAYARGTSADRAPVELVVTVERATLTGDDEQPATLPDGTGISAETCRRLACDCGVVDVRTDEHGTPLTVGRKTRTIPAALKRALLHRDGCCRFPGCSNQVFLEGHHAVHWIHGGPTSLTNIVSLCSRHHGWVHEHGWRVELDAHQQPHFFDPHGRHVAAVPPRPAPRALGWSHIRQANAPLLIQPDTAAPGWDGAPVQYSAVIDALVSVDASP